MGKIPLDVADLGTPSLKGIDRPIQVFSVRVRVSTLGQPTLTLPDKPLLVVLPFENMSDDPEQDYFADGKWAALLQWVSG